ncbi:MAG: response regulator transcription factor [Cyanobacteriota bacterium]|nr:response regulator transcription factor [Cyanobacteriota bacterium]
MRILLVDDEVELTEPLSRVLTREGYEVDVAHDGWEGSQLAARGGYHLFVLDWMLPHLSGLEICQQVRSRADLTPVLFLTAKDTLDDRVIGLDAGADDYLVKPFELRELLARVRALLRRSRLEEEVFSNPTEPKCDRLQVADLELDCENQVACRRGRTIELSQKESQLLEHFMRYPGQLLTHTEIYQHLWASATPPNSNVLPALIRLLRRKLSLPEEPDLIHTVYGKGYRFGN